MKPETLARIGVEAKAIALDNYQATIASDWGLIRVDGRNPEAPGSLISLFWFAGTKLGAVYTGSLIEVIGKLVSSVELAWPDIDIVGWKVQFGYFDSVDCMPEINENYSAVVERLVPTKMLQLSQHSWQPWILVEASEYRV